MQFVEAPKHVRHVLLQLRHVPSPTAALCRNCPLEQTVVQVPSAGSNVPPSTQDVQSFDVPPAHVAHEASHAWHVALASVYLPLGHAVKHAPSSKYLVPLDGQVRHSALAAPEHVSQLA